MKRPLTLVLLFFCFRTFSQQPSSIDAKHWVDSVFNSLTEDERIAQLMVVRMSSTDGKNITFYENEVRDAIQKYRIGGICLFQGGPLKQASLVNEMQSLSKTPLFISIDGENGLGMRMDSVMPLPRQMMMGAVDDPALIYEYGRLVGEQCKRIGIQINYAPDVDVNNNPANPVINDRSFGEDKYKVALYGMQYMRGMQDVGVMAVAKHFPGHGDVSVDSHLDLPVIHKSMAQLDSLELYPFRQIVKAGVGGVMVAHLSIPAIDDRPNIASSISYNSVTKLLRNDLGHKGLIITDALEMKGVSKYFQPGEISVKALQAGNDMLCLPGDVPGSIKKIKEAIKKKDLSWNDINEHVQRILYAKYEYGLSALQPVDLNHLVEDLNAKSADMRRLIAEKAITLLRNEDKAIFPLAKGKRVAYIGVGLTKDNAFAKEIREEYDAHVYYFDYKMSNASIQPLLNLMSGRYDVVVVGIHNYNRFPANDFGISKPAWNLIDSVQQRFRAITMFFGNPYAIKRECNSNILVACYDDDSTTQQTAADLLNGRFLPKGKLPVTICERFKAGDGLVSTRLLPNVRPADLGFRASELVKIDSIVNDAIRQRAIPGAVVLVAKDGKIAFERAYGYMGYDSTEAVYPETIYDLASVTKIMATTLSVMKLYDEGLLDLHKTLGDYLTWTRGTNKAHLQLWNIILHQAGLKAWIPFYRETLDPKRSESPSFGIYANLQDSSHNVRVAQNLYMRRDWIDTLYSRILQSAVTRQGVYIYSDLDFIFLGKIVERITGMSLDQYVKKTFYDPLHLTSISFKPREHFKLNNIAPTETEAIFRKQTLRGDVHDPGAAMFGGVAGHAGLFSNAYDIAVLCQMLLNGGTINGIRFFKKQTVDYFTAYHASSRRGLGFDKPERDNAQRAEPYPTLSASPFTFGHTGFTGTCFWVDPLHQLIYIFLSNRVYTNGDANRFLRMNIRPKVHELIYESLLNPSAFNTASTMDTPKM
jgi:beta-glucosidase-like glycosyl hydrolase/CubicO group peptidase (beta-lactamase class C family)